MRQGFVFALLIVLASCARDTPGRDGSPADRVAAPPVSDSTSTGEGAKESPSADSVMVRDTARVM